MNTTGFGLAPLVLLIIMVTPVSASDTPGPVQEAGQTAQDAADDASRQAQDAQDTVVGAAEETEEQARGEAQAARYLAEDVVLAAYGITQDVTFIVVGFATSVADEAWRTVCPHICPLTERNSEGGSRDADGRVRSTSSQTPIIVDPSADALVWVAATTGAGFLVFMAIRRLATLGLFPLLSRIAHSDIYNNDARRTIHELILAEPGLCLNELVKRTSCSRNAASYHLFVLEKEEEVVSVKDGKYRRYFSRNGKYVNGAKNVVAALRNETTLRLARAVVTRPGAIQRDLCIELGATPSATCWHAKRLLDLGVIRKERVANTVKYFPGEALLKYDLGDFGLVHRLDAASPAPAA